MRRLLALAVTLAFAAGCLDEAEPAPEPTPELVTDPFPDPIPVFELRACAGYHDFVAVDDMSVRAALPEGYRPYTVLGYAGALVALTLTTCDVVVDGVLTAGVALGWTSLAVYPPEFETGADQYVFEWLVPVGVVPTLAAKLADLGWTVRDAELGLAGDGLRTVRGPDVDYTVVDAPAAAGGTPAGTEGGNIRLHHQAGAHVILNMDYSAGGTEGGAPAFVASKGALAAFAPGGQASGGAGLSFRNTMDATFDDHIGDGEQPE